MSTSLPASLLDRLSSILATCSRASRSFALVAGSWRDIRKDSLELEQVPPARRRVVQAPRTCVEWTSYLDSFFSSRSVRSLPADAAASRLPKRELRGSTHNLESIPRPFQTLHASAAFAATKRPLRKRVHRRCRRPPLGESTNTQPKKIGPGEPSGRAALIRPEGNATVLKCYGVNVCVNVRKWIIADFTLRIVARKARSKSCPQSVGIRWPV